MRFSPSLPGLGNERDRGPNTRLPSGMMTQQHILERGSPGHSWVPEQGEARGLWGCAGHGCVPLELHRA